jgi:hypothetical protein
MPSNSFVSDVTKANTFGFGTADPAPGNAASGWYINTGTGKVSANDDKTANPGHILY